MLRQILLGFSSGIIALSALYLGVELVAGHRHLRRNGARLGTQAMIAYGHPHEPPPPAGWFTYFLVPALNESAVIGATVAALCGGDTSTHIVVIDDGSDDRTGDLAQTAARQGLGDTRHTTALTVLRRHLPEARKGKGAALNHAYTWVIADAAERELDPSRTIVCVMDADGRLSDGALSEVLPLFDDPQVGAAQLSVRIRNRSSFLLQYQDYLFWSMAAVTQFGRVSTGSVSLGGNGQFTRLSALNDLGEVPWTDSLTEDLDLGLRIAIAGWTSTSPARASVDQQAVAKLLPLIRQRTRWYQGHMMAAKQIPEIWASRKLPHRRALELVAYLIVPWILDLPWSILFHVCLIGMVTTRQEALGPGVNELGLPAAMALWYLVAFFPSIATGLLYWRRDRSVGIVRAMAFSHSTVVMNYLSFTCVWRAVYRMATGQHSWAKTQREREGAPVLLPARVALPARDAPRLVPVWGAPAHAQPGHATVTPLPVPTPITVEPVRLPSPATLLGSLPAAADLEVASAVAWEQLALLRRGSDDAERALGAAIDLLVDAEAAFELASLLAVVPGSSADRYRIEQLTAGSIGCDSGSVLVLSDPVAALVAMGHLPRGVPAVLEAVDATGTRVIASVDASAVRHFATPDAITIDALGSTATVVAAWDRHLDGVLASVATPVGVPLPPNPSEPAADHSEVSRLSRRVVDLEARVAELEQSLALVATAAAGSPVVGAGPARAPQPPARRLPVLTGRDVGSRPEAAFTAVRHARPRLSRPVHLAVTWDRDLASHMTNRAPPIRAGPGPPGGRSPPEAASAPDLGCVADHANGPTEHLTATTER